MAENVFNCIICPKCCTITWDGTRYIGAGCKRGEAFVAQELLCPLRTLTTTMKCAENGTVTMIPVKSREPVPLEEITDIVARIKKTVLDERPDIGAELNTAGIPLIVTG